MEERPERRSALLITHPLNSTLLESIVFNMDCMIGMAQYPDKFFDLAVVDPPYRNENQPTKEMRNKINGGMKNFGQKPSNQYFKELFRVSKNQIIWGGNNFLENLYSTNCFLFWYKNNPMPNYSDGEMAWTSFNSVAKCINIKHFGMHTADKDKIHPTQKPVKLYEWIYEHYLFCKSCDNIGSYYEDVCGDGGSKMLMACDECALGEGRNYRVLDTHLGSGSNRIAADKAGNIDFIGYELDKDYFEAQEKRWNNYKSQLKLFV